MTVLWLLWIVPLAAVAVGVDRRARARRTRRQVVDVLAMVADLSGEAAPGTGDRAAAWAGTLAERLEADPAVAAVAARLHGLPSDVVTESGISGQVADIVRDAANARRGHAVGAAAAVRVAHTFVRRTEQGTSQTSGALFSTVVEHPSGDERRAAEALVHLVQGGSSSA